MVYKILSHVIDIIWLFCAFIMVISFLIIFIIFTLRHFRNLSHDIHYYWIIGSFNISFFIFIPFSFFFILIAILTLFNVSFHVIIFLSSLLIWILIFFKLLFFIFSLITEHVWFNLLTFFLYEIFYCFFVILKNFHIIEKKFSYFTLIFFLLLIFLILDY